MYKSSDFLLDEFSEIKNFIGIAYILYLFKIIVNTFPLIFCLFSCVYVHLSSYRGKTQLFVFTAQISEYLAYYYIQAAFESFRKALLLIMPCFFLAQKNFTQKNVELNHKNY